MDTLKSLAVQYDERLSAMFQNWITELSKKDNSELLEMAFDIFAELNNYLHAAFRPNEEKAANLQADDLGYGAPFGGCLDFNADAYELREVIANICSGRFDHDKYPDHPYGFDSTGITQESLQSRLLEKLQVEYRDHVLNVFLEMDKAEFIWRAEAYLRLEPFFQELKDQIAEPEMGRDVLLRLLRLENTLNTVFTEYQGSSISDFINDEFMSDLRDSFMHDRNPDAPQPGLRLS
jgi:hypothetical protein